MSGERSASLESTLGDHAWSARLETTLGDAMAAASTSLREKLCQADMAYSACTQRLEKGVRARSPEEIIYERYAR